MLIHRETMLVWVQGLPSNGAGSAAPPATRVVRKATSQGTFEDYVMRPHYFEEITKQLKVTPTLDCFAHPGGAQCTKFLTQNQDSLTQEWPKEEILWLNPPWTLWPKATAKFLACENAGICIIPAWNTKWVRSLLEVATTKMLIER